MNIKTEFEKFMASKANEFVASKSGLSLTQMRELIEIVDTLNIDLNSLPKMVSLPETKYVRHKSDVSNDDINKFIFEKLTHGNMATRKELYHSAPSYFEGKLTEGDFVKVSTGITKINQRIYQQTRELLTTGKIAEFRSSDGKCYFHRVRNFTTAVEQQKLTIN
jgi:CRISPR/Cas system-associated endoribonuclease Cas2